jgi:hypothetical protein
VLLVCCSSAVRALQGRCDAVQLQICIIVVFNSSQCHYKLRSWRRMTFPRKRGSPAGAAPVKPHNVLIHAEQFF